MNRHHGSGSRESRKNREQGRARRACVGSLVLIAIATAALGFDDQAAPDLSGVFPADVPRDLQDRAWSVLDGNWEDWSIGTADAVAAFYEAEDSASRAAALDRLHVKLGTMETALADPAYSMIHAELADLHGRLSRRVAVADAASEMTNLDAARASRIARSYEGVAGALDALRGDLEGITGGSAWLPYIRADQVAEVVASGNSSADAQGILANAHSKIVNHDGLNPDQAEFLARGSFLGLATALERTIAAQNWSPPEGYRDELIAKLAELVTAIEAYEAGGGAEAAAAVRSHYNAVRAMDDGPTPIARAMRRSYYSFNMRVIASEGLMNRFAAETRTEPGTINEPISEAWVTGQSCTVANVSVDLKPYDQAAQFNIVLDGTVNATTTANANQAVVYGGSTGTFHAVRPVYFDGHEFNMDPSQVSANARTYANDVDAKVFFLLRPIADHIAEREVANRQAQSNATARTRMITQVREEMETETSTQFADAETKLEADVYGPLRELGWYPQQIRLSTTETELLLRGRLMEPAEMGASLPTFAPAAPADGIVIQVHETALNNGSARLDIAGNTMSESDLKAELEGRMKTLFGEDFEFGRGDEDGEAPPEPAETDPPAENVFIFDTVDPIRFEIGDGAVSIIMRTGLSREGEDDIDTHIISVPLSFRVEGDQVIMERSGSVGVRPAPGVRSNIAQQGIMRRNIRDAITERVMDAELNLEQQGKTVTLNVIDIQAIDGWVTVTAE